MAATFADDVLLHVDGVKFVGKADVRTWFSDQGSNWTLPPRPIDETRRQGVLVLTMLLSERCDEGDALVQRDWSLTVRDGDISELRSEPSAVLDLPRPLETYVNATNTSDLDTLLDVFHDDAIVNDQLQVYRGISAIRTWAGGEIIDAGMTMHPVSLVEVKNCVVVGANVNSNTTAPGMPDPLVLSFYFAVCDDEVTSLIILPDISNA
ncbi:MAG: nuclear transport factor 2 family protein [Beijerinckiaceae bacterium]|nr:nuclear transport factor 2 family protein [Beijerinckiaceae bacterium]